jgi:FdhD protein
LTKKDLLQGYIIAPNPDGVNLTKTVEGLDHFGNTVISQVIEEKPLTIYLNSQEIVTAMTIGDYPEYLAVGFLRNQGMLNGLNTVSSVDYDEDLSVVVVRTKTETSFEDKLKKKNENQWLCCRNSLWRYDGRFGRSGTSRKPSSYFLALRFVK